MVINILPLNQYLIYYVRNLNSTYCLELYGNKLFMIKPFYLNNVQVSTTSDPKFRCWPIKVTTLKIHVILLNEWEEIVVIILGTWVPGYLGT